jgi:(p)ppGpp synthase/HD superfamily hydrolase
MPHNLNQPLSHKFDEALQLATHLHREQARKGTQIPYIAHVLGVAALVLEYGGTETQASQPCCMMQSRTVAGGRC